MVRRNDTKAADSALPKFSILGTYEGECADANITNLNGLDITVPVWENVFNSDDYAQAIKLGWYIGFLGHPEDPNCMDFEHACIVMTEGHIDPNGKVYGKFNLIDTPVGRIVKAFQDAGVRFGISVRGAGDIENNSVDPDTFVFRGFDLVTFPAYPESIPTFSEIAASSDAQKRLKYKSVCSAVKDNLNKITMSATLDVIKSQFAAQSDEYKAITDRENEISEPDNLDLSNARIESMTKLYLEAIDANVQLKRDNDVLKRKLSTVQKQNSTLTQSCRKHISANKRLNLQIKTLKNSNLKYKHKIDANADEVRDKNSVISRLRSELDETVNAASVTESRTSNLDAQNRKLKSKLAAAESLISEYQDAYARLYANAIGVNLDQLSVTASTSVSEMQSLIGGTSTSNMSNVFVEPMPVEISDGDDADDEIVIM